MPLVSKAFGDIITFTRASTATYFDATGTLQSAAIDAPRFDYDPATLAAQGLLIEEARTNLLLQSEAFNTTWTTSNASVTANSTTAPTGTTVADTLVEDTATNFHYVQQAVSGTTNTNNYTLSCFIKASTRTAARIAIIEGTTFSRQIRATVDLSAGTVVGAALNSATLTAATITPVGNSWYRVTVAGVLGGTDTNILCAVYVGQDTATFSYTGNGTSGIFVWGAQLEAGAFPTSYIPTTTTALTRSADAASVNTLSPWYNATEGTLFAEFRPYVTTTSTLRSISYIDSSIPLYILQSTSTLRSFDGTTAFATANGITGEVIQKSAVGYGSSSASLVLNADTVATGSFDGSYGTSALYLGKANTSANFLNGYLRRITYYPRRLSDAELQAITA